MALTSQFVRTVKPESRVRRYHDKHGLMLVVQPSGSKQWIQRITIRGKRCDLGLGSYPYFKLSEARERAIKNRADVMRGSDPRRPRTPHFSQIVDEYWTLHRGEWRATTLKNKGTQRNKLADLNSRRVSDIHPDTCIRVLRPLYESGNAIAKPTRVLLRSILDLAVTRGLITSNPAGAALDAALPTSKRDTKHHAAIEPSAALAAYQRLVDAPGLNENALRLVMLTACRSQEVGGMRWDEISNRVWTIPADRMKSKRPHTVPLSDPAIQLLDELRERNPENAHVFAGRTDKPLHHLALNRTRKKNAIGGTVHGLRATFADWAHKSGHSRETIDLCLAHAVGSQTSRSYIRGTLQEQRREIMQAWSEYLAPPAF